MASMRASTEEEEERKGRCGGLQKQRRAALHTGSPEEEQAACSLAPMAAQPPLPPSFMAERWPGPPRAPAAERRRQEMSERARTEMGLLRPLLPGPKKRSTPAAAAANYACR